MKLIIDTTKKTVTIPQGESVNLADLQVKINMMFGEEAYLWEIECEAPIKSYPLPEITPIYPPWRISPTYCSIHGATIEGDKILFPKEGVTAGVNIKIK